VVAFAASVIECFTGYVAQQNFGSHRISASGKDAFNSGGVGEFLYIIRTWALRAGFDISSDSSIPWQVIGANNPGAARSPY
jgi:hypothetical protein